MATKVAVKYTFNLNGNKVWWQNDLTSADPTWNDNFPAWKDEFTTFMNNHALTSSEAFKADWTQVGDTMVTTYVVDGATAETIETLVKTNLWALPLAEAFLWRDSVYNPTKGIVKTNTEITTVNV